MSLVKVEKPRYNVAQLKKLGRYPLKHCESDLCGKRLMPKVLSSGQLESLAQFEKRRGCNRQCAGQIRRQDHVKRRLEPEEPTPKTPDIVKASEPTEKALRCLLKVALHHHDPHLLEAWPDAERGG